MKTGAGAVCLLGAIVAAGAEPCQITGSVRDPAGRPVVDAVVLVEQLGGSTTTDREGRYCLNGLAKGTYHLLATADSFQLLHSHPVVVDGNPTVVDLALVPSFRAEAVVTGTRTERRLDEVPVRTEVVRREAIAQSEARTLADAVEFTSGVRVENNCQNCNFQQVRLLGLEDAYTQLLVDSQPIISSLAQVYGIEHIPARKIERLEVVKGGGSAVYGAGSVGGVVNVIPRLPLRSGGEVEYRRESVDGEASASFSGAVDWVSPNQDLFVSGFGQVDSIDEVDVDGDGFTELGRRRMTSYGVRAASFLLSGDARLSFDYAHVEEDRRGGNNLDQPEFMADVAESVDAIREVASVSWMHTAGPRIDYRLTFSYADTDRDTYYGSGKALRRSRADAPAPNEKAPKWSRRHRCY